jgi:hypothetical protein
MGRISAHRMLSLLDTLHEIQSRTARFLKHNSPPPHVKFKFVPTVILPTPDLVPTKNTTLIRVFTWVAFPTDSRATGVSKASLLRSNKWETLLRWTVQVNFLLQQHLQLLHSAVISFSLQFFFCYQWARISQSVQWLRLRVGRSGNRGSIPCGTNDVFRHYALTKSKPVQSPGRGAFLWGTVTLETGSTEQQLIGIHKYIHAQKNVIYNHISVT